MPYRLSGNSSSVVTAFVCRLASKFQTIMDAFQKGKRRAFIFQQELIRLSDRLNAKQEGHGNIFGLWTTAGEAVVYLMGSSRCWPENNNEHTRNFYSKTVPLEHIGDWWYISDDSEQHQEESVPCCHERRPDFLHLLIAPSTLLLKSAKNGTKEIIFLPHETENPFRRMEHIEEFFIEGENEESETKQTNRSTECDNHSDDSSSDESYELLQGAFIFRKDHDTLISMATRGVQGKLFGLWTTNGEPVVHIIGDPNGSLSKDVPLEYIGNWRSCNYLPPPTQKKLPAIVDSTAKSKVLDVIVRQTKLQASINGREMKLEIIPTESPLRHLKGTREVIIETDEEDSHIDQAADALKHLSINSSEERVICNSPNYDLTQALDTRRRYVQENPAYLSTQLYRNEFAINRHNFKVLMYEEDYRMMVNLVLKYQNLETGGDLFGLWTTSGNAVLHVILGPGENCKRTGASFYQDIRYLQRNGELLTEDYMLCHIGEWHSHHQLHLFQPSGGDSSTVIRNYPRGVCGFLLIIANILSSHRVELSPYLYTKNSSHGYDLKGELIVMPVPNLFKRMRKIKESMHQGKELQTYSEDLQYFSYWKFPNQTKNYPLRTPELPEDTNKRYSRTRYLRRTPISHRSKLDTPKHYRNRRHSTHAYKSTWLTSPKNIHNQPNKTRITTRLTTKSQNMFKIRPKWKP